MSKPPKNPTANSDSTSSINIIPAKDFFVRMLTRDIALEDAVLDLLDNCVDGILRSKSKLTGSLPYKGFFAHVVLSSQRFSITDNCGGIPWDERDRAFKLGREKPTNGDHVENGKSTIGAYGIGMKRALFKMGRHSVVVTKHDEEEAWKVEIGPAWFNAPGLWDIPVKRDASLRQKPGTELTVTALHDGVAKLFDEQNAHFRKQLIKRIKTQYAYILEKGFEVKVGSAVVEPKTTKLLFGPSDKKDSAVIAPYVYRSKIKDVDVFLAVGFTEKPQQPEEFGDPDSEICRRKTDDAGWTVLCNERAIVFNDKTLLTGWGESPVPQYHTQFIAVAGVVEFRSNNPSSLPMTTTKHGVDASSELYLHVKNYMREGMLRFTRYTNKWKKYPDKVEAHFEGAGEPLSIDDIERRVKSRAFGERFKKPGKGEESDSVYNPPLPEPTKLATDKRISFTRPIEKVDLVRAHLFGDDSRKADEVGAACFDIIHKEAVKAKKR